MAALVGMVPVTVIGFAASYETLAALALTHGFSPHLAPWLPLGIDGAIIAFLALDLYLTARRIPWPLLRFAAHAMTAATVVFNASESALTGRVWADPVRAAWHGVMPLLFVVGVEGARRLLVHVGRLEDGTASDAIPLHRWILAPVRTARLYRRMRLATVRSYPEMVQREQDLEGYRVWLTQELDGDLSKANEVQLLPMTMAPRGYTVAEALALPAKWRAEAAERARAQAEAERAEAEAERERAEAEQRRAKLARLRELEDRAELEAAEHQSTVKVAAARAQAERAAAEAAGQTEEARAQARARAEAARLRAEHTRRAAERQAQAEAELLESAEAAEARKRRAEAERAAAEADRAAAESRLEAERLAAEADRLEAERVKQVADKAVDAQRRAEADRAAAEAGRAAAEARAEAARLMAAAEAAEDYARLTPRERNQRRAARLIWAAGSADAVPLQQIQDACRVGRTIAGELRQEAAQLLAAGYDPTTGYDPEQQTT
ncbi:DUF2637 domain-containing protein [Streptomyces somaliensis]|uniref:DUF2637 domain-containing protein n=1 Tax=Streptomyces somaliensis TaxID=78355 RepID=UPI0020CEB798|nr:DUF2637 domain-containing protein [Streptomyces somaliensis]MCP9946789.1 DUF2637 domain-containing protein [Streptomyces somaliensis]MCP9963423.1 DUF2637 domain-containing protein [Streptomyces somaliensis]